MIESSQPLNSFEAFMKVRLQASTDFLEGNFESLEKISTMKSPATIFPPSGVCIQGTEAVNHFNENGATHFLPKAKNEFEVLHQGADQNLAYWTGLQRSIVHIKGQKENVIFTLRVTEIFRKENQEWKLIHRHADNFIAS